MSRDQTVEFTKENIDLYLKEVAKEYRRLVGKKMPAELILIGGASVLLNYGFRSMTTNIDAMIQAASGMKDAITIVRDRYELPTGWLNSDFQNTTSFSPKLVEFSKYYRTYSNVLSIRTVSAEYLIAMKLRSGRQYKNDFSDVLGILAEHERRGTPITMQQIERAVTDLYGDWFSLEEGSRIFIENAMSDGNFRELYRKTAEGEKETKELLIQFERNYPGVTSENNVDNIAENLQKKETRAAVLAELRRRK